MRISDWSSDVCSSDLLKIIGPHATAFGCRLYIFGQGSIGQAVSGFDRHDILQLDKKFINSSANRIGNFTFIRQSTRPYPARAYFSPESARREPAGNAYNHMEEAACSGFRPVKPGCSTSPWRLFLFERITMKSTQADAPALSHLDESGQIRMVDVSGKAPSQRCAIAQGRVRMSAQAYRLLTAQENGKGEVLNTARVAGVLAAKRCAELIPLCHSLPLSFAGIEFSLDDAHCCITVKATCRTDYKTGVEMEAMTACSIAALTIYDMCKAADKGIVLEHIRLRYKAGGKSGEWHND